MPPASCYNRAMNDKLRQALQELGVTNETALNDLAAGNPLPAEITREQLAKRLGMDPSDVYDLTRARLRAPLEGGAHRRWTAPGVTFPLANVQPGTEPFRETALWNTLRENFHPLEACSDRHALVLERSSSNSLIQAAYLAFSQHRPLVLSPDMLWLCVLHGVCDNIGKQPETWREHYVRHEGQVTLTVERPDFVPGSPDNPWEELFDGFSEGIGLHVSEKNHRFFQCDFSTSGPREQAAARVMMMSAMRRYFEYEARCICGIPQVTLEGTPADWRRLEHKVGQLEEHGLGAWGARLQPLVGQFVRASEGDVDRAFWMNLFQLHDPDTGAYGGPVDTFTGWIADFSLREPAPEPLRVGSAWTFPPVIGMAPLRWKAAGYELDLELCAGLVGIEQRPEDLALRPKIGWVVKRVED